jgi:hypothetical protein
VRVVRVVLSGPTTKVIHAGGIYTTIVPTPSTPGAVKFFSSSAVITSPTFVAVAAVREAGVVRVVVAAPLRIRAEILPADVVVVVVVTVRMSRAFSEGDALLVRDYVVR